MLMSWRWCCNFGLPFFLNIELVKTRTILRPGPRPRQSERERERDRSRVRTPGEGSSIPNYKKMAKIQIVRPVSYIQYFVRHKE